MKEVTVVKYSKKAGDEVKKAMRERKKETLKGGSPHKSGAKGPNKKSSRSTKKVS